MIRFAAFLALALLTSPDQAHAFCGFFVSGADADLQNDATQVVLMRKGDHTVLTMSNNYKGPPKDFAMVIPVPVVLKKANVKTLSKDVFTKIDKLSAPRLVEYWEQNPCRPQFGMDYALSGSGGMGVRGYGRGGGGTGYGVKIEAKFSAGEYDVVILSAQEANGLEGWLRHNQYQIPDGAAEALAPYIRDGMKFFVAKVNIKKVKKDKTGTVVLSPLRFDYRAKELRLPVRLGLLNAQGKQDLLIYILHPNSRFKVANYPNIFIPSNLEVDDSVRQQFGAFYADLFDATMAKHGGKGVVTEYAWQTTSCDPCPVPPLQPKDMLNLGGDILNDQSGRFGFSSWVLTRLHTRYSQKTLSEDLIFTQARPVVGGRGANGISQEKPGAVEHYHTNNFQGRYIIRNYWKGKVTCDNPNWNLWGGPPNAKKKKAKAATGIAAVKRGTIKLSQVVRSALPQLNLPGKPEPTH